MFSDARVQSVAVRLLGRVARPNAVKPVGAKPKAIQKTTIRAPDIGTAADIGSFEYNSIPSLRLIRGRVTDAGGRALYGAIIKLSTSTGSSKYAVSNPFGYFRFQEVLIGDVYIFIPQL